MPLHTGKQFDLVYAIFLGRVLEDNFVREIIAADWSSWCVKGR